MVIALLGCDNLAFAGNASPADSSVPTAQADKNTPSAFDDAEDSEKTEVTVKGQYIYISTPRATTFRLYSILGQLISRHNVQPGTTRIKAPSRGVYILQIGSLTKRLTINS